MTDLTRKDIKALIRTAGLRATAGRVGVYQQLVDAVLPLTHSDLVEAMIPLGLDQATIYRNLVDLTRAGLLRRTDLGDHIWRFELKGHAHVADHPHFVCIDCGSVTCLDTTDVTLADDGPAVLGGEALEIQIRGRCEECG